jgi:hypothetical protein
MPMAIATVATGRRIDESATLVLGFRYRHTLSRVFTIDHRSYQICFKCAGRVEYSLEQMHSIEYSASTDAQQRRASATHLSQLRTDYRAVR